MTRYTIFATRDGRTSQIKADPANLDKQRRDLTALGYTVDILDDDDRIRFGRIAAALRAAFNE